MLIPNWIHSCKVKTADKGECIIVKEKIFDTENNTWTDNLKFIKDPYRHFWIHQQKYRTYKYKREYADMNECDKYKVKNVDLVKAIKQQLGIYSGKDSLREVCNSPYVYGADIDIQVLIKMSYLEKSSDLLVPYTVGAMDSEANIWSDYRINILSFIHGRSIYVGILHDYLLNKKTNDGSYYTISDIHETVLKEIGDILDKYKFNVEYQIFNTDIEIIKYIFSKIHYHKTDFISIWNMPFDMGFILKRIQDEGLDPYDILVPKEVPRDYGEVRYYKDPKVVDHFTLNWDMCYIPGYTQVLCSMRLYSRLRIIKGKESSYALDYITKKEIDLGKQKIIGTHHEMQEKHFLEYIAYNIMDNILLILLEEKNKDISSMTQLLGNSLIGDFSKQTILLKNAFYQYCIERGKVPATVGTQMLTPYDELVPKLGGTVLPPYLISGAGLKAIKQRPNHETLINIFVKDEDVGSEYPNTMSGLNISKETKLSTMIGINGFKYEDIEPLFGGLASPMENAVPLCNKYFNLPNYQEMLKLYQQYLSEQIKTVDYW